MDINDFWQMANEQQLRAEVASKDYLQWVATASAPALRRLFIEYRPLTDGYPADLALLVARTPQGRLRSLLAQLLDEELGDGDPAAAHIVMLDDFMRSIGVADEDLGAHKSPVIAGVLEEMNRVVRTSSVYQAVAMRGMGSECVCQTYLEALHEQLLKNEWLTENRPSLDWTFWDIHAGPADQAHNAFMREAVDQLMRADPSSVDELAAGYRLSQDLFDRFFGALVSAARSDA